MAIGAATGILMPLLCELLLVLVALPNTDTTGVLLLALLVLLGTRKGLFKAVLELLLVELLPEVPNPIVVTGPATLLPAAYIPHQYIHINLSSTLQWNATCTYT